MLTAPQETREPSLFPLNTAFAVNALVSMIMKALNVYCVIHTLKGTFTNNKLRENNFNTYDQRANLLY